MECVHNKVLQIYKKNFHKYNYWINKLNNKPSKNSKKIPIKTIKMNKINNKLLFDKFK